jgi:hypothetical protein
MEGSMLRRCAILCIALAMTATEADAAPHPGPTTVLGPFTGHDAPLHPSNEKPQRAVYYGTDLGWSYEHDGKIQLLFGDTLKVTGEPIAPTHDDVFGTIDLAQWPDPTRISPSNLPRVLLAQKAASVQLATLDPGHPMEGLKTPVAGFSNGVQEFALFITGKPEACRADSECGNGLTCDMNLGLVGERPEQQSGLTFACAPSWPGCRMEAVSNQQGASAGGFCVDRKSSMWSESDYGRVSSVAWKHIVGVRAGPNSGTYAHTRRWLTNKFINVATRVVTDFAPERTRHDYRAPRGAAPNQRVLLWGRPHFIGVNAKGASLGMYFAYADMPVAPDFNWTLSYFAGRDANGKPRFSSSEGDAVAVDLDAARAGVQAQEVHDIVQHMSVVWVEPLRKWVMFYGGSVSKVPVPIAPRCGVLEVFVRTECASVELGNGAIRMRTADDPWGPWSAPQDVFVGGNPDARPVADQYASGGVLHHPACAGPKCQSASTHLPKADYGWLYGANIIEQWTQPAGTGVDVWWIASTWDPYRVILLKTRIER